MRNQKIMATSRWTKKTVALMASGLLATCTIAASAQVANHTLVRPKTAVNPPSKVMKPATVTSGPTIAADRYRIGPGDVLEIKLYKLPDLSRDALRVEASGTIRMPLIEDDIPAACRTEGELAKDIAARYLPLMRNPQVDVFVKEYNSRPVAVIGAVTTPGRFQLQRRIRLLDLLSYAGGPAERAGGVVQVVHAAGFPVCENMAPGASANSNDEIGLNVFRLRDTLAGNSRSNPYVRPGDVITVLESEQIYVIGNVLRPSSFPLKERVTLTQAVAMAGGTLPDSQSSHVRIVRQDLSTNTKQELVADLKAINQHRAPDVVLQPNDIVEVPTANGRRLLRNILEGVVPGMTRFPPRIIR